MTRFKESAIGLLLPSHHRLHDEPPKFWCNVCQMRGDHGGFYSEQAYLDHVNGTPTRPGCADRHPETIRQMSPQQQAPSLFGDKGSDIEWRDWLQKHDREIREGRMNDKTSDGKS